MIRRHALEFRAAQMAADAALAAILLVGLSIWRFGADWAVWWRQIVPEPTLFLTLYAVAWVIVLTLNGLYRPRARWSLRSEAADVLQATMLMALATLSVLFLLNLPDVSRGFLLVLFPAQAAMTILSRAILRAAMERLRRRGINMRHVLVLGAGPRGQRFAAKLEDHRELGLRIEGFLDSTPDFELPAKWRYLGPLEELEAVLHDHVVDEVAICLPFSQWTQIDTISRVCEEEGKIVRIPMDMHGSCDFGRPHRGAGRDARVLARVGPGPRARPGDQAHASTWDWQAMGLVVLSPLFAGSPAPSSSTAAGRSSSGRRRVGLHGRPFHV